MKVRNNNGQPMKDFIPYVDARTWVTRLGFENYKQWLRFSKMRYKKGPLKGRLIRPLFIPANPQCSYAIRGEWINDTDFLGPRPSPYLTYEEAAIFARSLNLTSSHHWDRWYKENRQDNIPRYPHLVYKDWTIWADFLGSKFIHWSKRHPRPPMNEAIKLLHEVKLESANEYRQWVRDNPIYNLPTYPEAVYEGFPGWGMYLGKTVADKIEVFQNIDVSVLYIAHYSYHPSNVFEIRIDQKGKSNVELRSKQKGFRVLKMYSVVEDETTTAMQIVNSNGSEWWESDHTYLVGNIHELLFQLGVLLVSV